MNLKELLESIRSESGRYRRVEADACGNFFHEYFRAGEIYCTLSIWCRNLDGVRLWCGCMHHGIYYIMSPSEFFQLREAVFCGLDPEQEGLQSAIEEEKQASLPTPNGAKFDEILRRVTPPGDSLPWRLEAVSHLLTQLVFEYRNTVTGDKIRIYAQHPTIGHKTRARLLVAELLTAEGALITALTPDTWARLLSAVMAGCENRVMWGKNMNFNELKETVKQSAPLIHVATNFGMTFLAEVYRSRDLAFSLVARHPAAGNVKHARLFVASVGNESTGDVSFVALTAAEFFELRETINFCCKSWAAPGKETPNQPPAGITFRKGKKS